MLPAAILTISGIQTYFYVPQFRWKRAKSHTVWKCPHSRDDPSYTRLNCICCYTSKSLACSYPDAWLVMLIWYIRFALHCLPRPFFPGQTPSLIRRDFTAVYLTYLMMLTKRTRSMICSHGGIGTSLYLSWWLAIQGCKCYSQVFPSYSSARRPVCKNSALARIKEKRLELKALATNTP